MEETVDHNKIFGIYYVMGKDRSLAKLRKKLMHPKCTQNAPSLDTLKRWSRSFHWQEKVKQTDTEVSEILKKKLKKTAVNSKADYRELIKEVIDKFKEKLKEGKIKMSKPQDIIEMIKLDLLVMGEPTGREEHLVTHKLIEVDIGKYPKQNEKNNISG